MTAEKRKRLEAVEEYNPRKDERDEWRRLVRKYAGKITGEVILHTNEGEPLKVRTRRVVKTGE